MGDFHSTLTSIEQVLVWLHSLWFWIVTIGLGYGAIWAFRIYGYVRSRRLIKRVLLAPDAKPAEANSRMRLIAEADAYTLFRSRTNRFAIARRLVELEIINPATDKPNPNDFGKDQYPIELADWEAVERERRGNIVANLRSMLVEDPDDYDTSPWNLKELLLRQLRYLLQKIKSIWRSATPIDDARARRPEPPTLNSFAELDQRRVLIMRYFRVLSEMEPERKPTFLTQVQVALGYLAPIFLVTGILNRFDEEKGWRLIIDRYRKLVRHDDVYSTETRELRAFLFNCWLLWGPSIPHCTCDLWKSWKDKDRSIDSTDAAYQYGYGDENQSIDVFVKDNEMHDFRQTVMGRLRFNPDALDPRLGFRPMSRLAIPYRVRGHFKWGPDLDEHEVCQAQQLIRGGSAGSQDPSQGRILLECKPSDFKSTSEDDTSNYYSAYLWIIFVLQDELGNPFFSTESDKWKNILCYFEHGNIADATTFQALKENLAIKACSSISDIFAREAAMNRKMKIAYACALDDSNCEHGTLVYPVEPIEFHASAAPELRAKTARIVDIFRTLTEDRASDGGGKAKFPHANQALAEKRLVLPPDQAIGEKNEYSSCRLPELVEGFYRQLDRGDVKDATPAAAPALN